MHIKTKWLQINAALPDMFRVGEGWGKAWAMRRCANEFAYLLDSRAKTMRAGLMSHEDAARDMEFMAFYLRKQAAGVMLPDEVQE